MEQAIFLLPIHMQRKKYITKSSWELELEILVIYRSCVLVEIEIGRAHV